MVLFWWNRYRGSCMGRLSLCCKWSKEIVLISWCHFFICYGRRSFNDSILLRNTKLLKRSWKYANNGHLQFFYAVLHQDQNLGWIWWTHSSPFFCSHVLQSNGRGGIRCFCLFCFVKNPRPKNKRNPKDPNAFFSSSSASSWLAMESLRLL